MAISNDKPKCSFVKSEYNRQHPCNQIATVRRDGVLYCSHHDPVRVELKQLRKSAEQMLADRPELKDTYVQDQVRASEMHTRCLEALWQEVGKAILAGGLKDEPQILYLHQAVQDQARDVRTEAEHAQGRARGKLCQLRARIDALKDILKSSDKSLKEEAV